MDKNKTENDRKAEERRFWDGYAEKYDSFTNDKTNVHRIYRIITDTVTAQIDKTDTNGELLEVAAGTGTLSFALAGYFRTVTACDLSESMIRVATRKLEESGLSNITFEVQDAYDLPYPDNRFDIVLASNTLHVMKEPRRALASMRRVVKDGGKLVVPTYCHGETVRSRMFSSLMSLGGFRVFSKWSMDGFQDFLASEGFRLVDFSVVPGKISMAVPVLEKRIEAGDFAAANSDDSLRRSETS